MRMHTVHMHTVHKHTVHKHMVHMHTVHMHTMRMHTVHILKLSDLHVEQVAEWESHTPPPEPRKSDATRRFELD